MESVGEPAKAVQKRQTPGSCTAQGGRGGPGDYISSVAQGSVPINPRFVAALRRAISADRFASYLRMSGQDDELACRLYLWDADIGVAVLRDIAIVEIALRNALAHQLESVLGSEWFNNPAMERDQRLVSARDRAIQELTVSGKAVTSGRMTAQLSLGFWVNLLASPSDPLWRASLFKAFPGGKHMAVQTGQRYGRFWVHSQAQIVQVMRNRCAHHEPLLNGFPLPGQQKRMSAADGVAVAMRLARALDRDLADWLQQSSTTNTILGARPQPIQTAGGQP